MKINVLTVDKQIIPLDVDHNDLVGNVKAMLKIEKEVLLYNGKELKNSDTLSEIGVQDGDSVVVVSETMAVSGSSTPELGVNTNGSAKKLAAFQHEIRNNSYLVAQLVQSDPEFAQAIAEDDHHRLQALLRQRHQQREQSWQRDGEHGFTNSENAPKNGEGEVCLTFLAEKEMSHLLNEEKYSKQQPVGGNYEVNEEVKVQTNDGSTHSEENSHGHAPNSSDKKSSTASIQKVGLGDLNDFGHFYSHEHHNDSQEIEARNSELRDPSLSPSMASPSSPNPPQSTTKGHGLKKWRRIRREFTKDPSSSLDSTKVLKRGSSNISDVKKPNHSPMSSTNAFVKSPGPADLFSDTAPSSNYNVAVDTTFSAGADDSDDRNSKSSTAASAPKYSHHQREKHKVKNVSGKHLNHISGQRFQLAKGHAQADASKKPRGESINLDNETSLSSMESDSRSYNSVFPRRSSSVNSDQVQSGKSAHYDEDYDQQASEVQSSKPLQAGDSKNCNISPECSAAFSYGASTEKCNDHQVSKDCEPLINSILLLQSAQEALEREVQMFKEIGKGVSSFCDDSSNTNGLSAHSLFVGPKSFMDRSHCPEAAFNHVRTLERQLDETKVKLKEKDLKVLELEKIIIDMNMKSSQEMEAELEAVFKLKIEAEVQYFVMEGFSKDLGVLVDDQIKLLRDQYLEQSQKLIADVRNEGSILQGQSKMDNSKNDITDYDEIQNMQSRMSKYSSYLIIQLVLLVLVVGLFLLQVLPKSVTVVPT